MNDKPVMILLSGANAAGKSTLGNKLKKECGVDFINPDAIIKESLGYHPLPTDTDFDAIGKAHDRVKEKISDAFEAKETFILERVTPDLNIIREAKEAGFDVYTVFVGIDNVEKSKIRAKVRHKRDGGLYLTDEEVEYNYNRSINGLKRTLGITDAVFLYDNRTIQENGERAFTTLAVASHDEIVCFEKDIPSWSEDIVNSIKERYEDAKIYNIVDGKLIEQEQVENKTNQQNEGDDMAAPLVVLAGAGAKGATAGAATAATSKETVLQGFKNFAGKVQDQMNASSDRKKQVDLDANNDVAATKTMINFIASLFEKGEKGQEGEKQDLINNIQGEMAKGKEMALAFLNGKDAKEKFGAIFGDAGGKALEHTINAVQKGSFGIKEVAEIAGTAIKSGNIDTQVAATATKAVSRLRK